MHVAIVHGPIDVGGLAGGAVSAECGASAIFVGTVRNANEGREVTGIEYTAYESMAKAEMHRIAREAAERFGTDRILAEHRVGRLEVGEVSIAIVVAHAHRTPAIDAMRYMIEEIKKRVPVWKREHYADGTREWVDATVSVRAAEQRI